MTIPPEYERLPNGTLHRIDGAITDYKAPYWGVDGHSEWEDQKWNVNGFTNEEGITKTEAILKHCWGTTLLEIGCAPGSFLKAAGEQGFICHGVEPNEQLAERIFDESGAHYVYPGIFEQIDFQDRKWDNIVAMDVLEHVEDPVKFVDKALSLLNPGGRLILMCPFIFDDGKWDDRQFHPEHLWLFSQQHLREWLKPSVFDRFCTGHEIVVVEK